MSSGLPAVAIIGKVNSGKSTLFNRITRSRRAITHVTPGVTRDSMEMAASWSGRDFILVDTGGFSFGAEDPFQDLVNERIRKAVEEADAVIFLVDVDTGPTREDERILHAFRRSREKMVLAVNKVENAQDEIGATDFHGMGFPSLHMISALHGTGVGDLLDVVVGMIPDSEAGPPGKDRLRVAVTGRPNVGKSSLINALAGNDRQIISDLPGTTRDTLDVRIRYHGETIVLTDTAGVRRRARTKKGLDSIASMMSLRSVEKADVVLAMLDASAGAVTNQDVRIAALAHKARKGVIIVLNKWDLVEKRTGTLEEFSRDVREALSFLSYAPLISISATGGTRVSRILPEVMRIQQERMKKIPTSELNRLLEDSVRANPPKYHAGGTGKIYYGTQTGTGPPTFTLFVNKAAYFPRSYVRYINNCVRKLFTFDGTAVRIALRSKE